MVECSKTVIDAIELGMEEEKKASDFYVAAVANGVSMFEKMAKKEDQHARILEDQLYDVKNRGELVWGD